MLTSIRQVHEEFFRTFHGISVNIRNIPTKIPCRYARKSSYDYTEEQPNQVYPCIVIQDYTPELKEEWYVDMRQYFGGLSSDGLRGYLYNRPVWMSFRYDVSIAAKGYSEFVALQDYFLKHFVYGLRLIFNKRLSGDATVGDVVPYEIRETDIPRTDGVYEKNYEFTLSAWVYPQDAEEVETLQKVIVKLSRSYPDVESDYVTEDDKVIITADEKELSNVYRSSFTASEVEEILKKAVVSEDVDEIKSVDSFDEAGEHNSRTLYVVKEE